MSRRLSNMIIAIAVSNEVAYGMPFHEAAVHILSTQTWLPDLAKPGKRVILKDSERDFLLSLKRKDATSPSMAMTHD